MRSAFAALVLILLPLVRAAAQEEKPAFEAADVHVSAAGATESGGFLPAGRLEYNATTLLQLISLAYSVPPERISGGPSWLDTDRFDVVAKGPSSAARPALLSMLRTLLEERFDLSVKSEDKTVPVYALVPGKGPAPKESKAAEPGCKRANEDNVLTLTCQHMTMASLAESLRMVAPAYFTRPVVDRTGLEGAYDFKLTWLGRGQLPPGPEGLANSQSIFTSLEKQLGVRVESQTAPQPVLTVERANRTPSPNPPGVTEKLGAPATEFDVAEVRPSAPGEKEDLKEQNGLINAKAVGLKDLIQFAYNLEDDALKGAPGWLDSEKFDIVAKTAPTASDDTFRTLTRALLAQRFGLRVHNEVQPVNVYALTAVKPKLKDADPSERTTCRLSLENGNRSYTCTNVSMALFASKLRDVANGYFDHPVVDLTGLKGAYDFTVTWSPRGRTLVKPGSTQTEAAVPTAELTVFEAVARQLGLKLAVQKHPMPVVVIDHVERKPTEN
jgi:uncharacterized protein (TIGR03435 family)